MGVSRGSDQLLLSFLVVKLSRVVLHRNYRHFLNLLKCIHNHPPFERVSDKETERESDQEGKKEQTIS